jgi:hypothetical protein
MTNNARQNNEPRKVMKFAFHLWEFAMLAVGMNSPLRNNLLSMFTGAKYILNPSGEMLPTLPAPKNVSISVGRAFKCINPMSIVVATAGDRGK